MSPPQAVDRESHKAVGGLLTSQCVWTTMACSQLLSFSYIDCMHASKPMCVHNYHPVWTGLMMQVLSAPTNTDKWSLDISILQIVFSHHSRTFIALALCADWVESLIVNNLIHWLLYAASSWICWVACTCHCLRYVTRQGHNVFCDSCATHMWPPAGTLTQGLVSTWYPVVPLLQLQHAQQILRCATVFHHHNKQRPKISSVNSTQGIYIV